MRRFFNSLVIGICTVIGITCIQAKEVSAASLPAELNVDYADYNPLSIVIKKFNWFDKEFQADNVKIRWRYSPSSVIALNNLNTKNLDMASSAIVSATLSRAGGKKVKAVYIFARTEFSSILVSHNSPINSVSEFKGKRIATPPGNSSHFFLLRALNEVGLHKDDVVIVPLEHAEGRVALEKNEVDAWSSIQPHTSLSQLEAGSREIYRNPRFNTSATLIISEDFIRKYPDVVTRVIKVYERARKWALRHPDDLENIYADEKKLPLLVARKVLSRLDFFNPVIDRNDIAIVKEASSILKEEQLVSPDTDLDKVVDDLIDRSFTTKVLFNPEHHNQ
jgi:sulfonate transport system substrate-binding protein